MEEIDIKAVVLKVIQFSFGIINDFFCALIDAFAKNDGFNAEFGSERLIGSRFKNGFVLSKHRKTSRNLAYSNMLITGVTGKGKSTHFIIKNLLTLRNCSLLIHDPSGELYNLTSGHLAKYFEVKVLNFSDYTVSSGYNFLSRVSKPSDVNKLAHLLVSASLDKGSGGDPFWSLASKSLLQIFIRLILHQPEQYRNISNVIQVVRLFAATSAKVDKWIAETNDEKLIIDYKAAISTPERTLQNIIASLSAALELYDSPDIAKVSAYDNIDFSSLRKKPQAIFLHSSVADQAFLSTLTSVFFDQFYNQLLQQLPKKQDLDVFCILDETGILRIPLLPTVLSNCRKFRNGNLLCIQSKNQLKAFYKEDAENITSNCLTKIFLPGISAIDELKEVEALSGKCTYKDSKGIEKTRPLISVDEIRLLPDNRTIILCSNHPIIKGRSSSFFRSLIFKRYTKILPLPMVGHIPNEPIPMLA